MSTLPLSPVSAKQTPVQALYVPPVSAEFSRSLEAIDRTFLAVFKSLPDLSDLNLPQYTYSGPAFTEIRTCVKRATSVQSDSEGERDEITNEEGLPEDPEEASAIAKLQGLVAFLVPQRNYAPPVFHIASSSSQGLFPRTQSARLPLSERVQPATSGLSLPADMIERMLRYSPLQMPSPPQTNHREFLQGRLVPPPIEIPEASPEVAGPAERRMYVAKRNPDAQALRLGNEPPFTPPPREGRSRSLLSLIREMDPPEQTKKRRGNE